MRCVREPRHTYFKPIMSIRVRSVITLCIVGLTPVPSIPLCKMLVTTSAVYYIPYIEIMMN